MALASLLVAVSLLGTGLTAEELPSTVVDVRIEGNETIPSSTILQKVHTQPRRALTNRQVREDVRNLMNTRWFYSVQERFESGPDGDVLVFQVHERPIVRRVEFLGLKKVKLKELKAWTGLEVGSPFDHIANREAVERIKQEYQEKGFYFVHVDLVRGSEPQDREVIFRINEGPKVRVQEKRFVFVGQGQSGNKFVDHLTWLVSDRVSKDGAKGLSPDAARLRTKTQTKEAFLGLFGGLYKPDSLDQDIESLKQYYRGLGFFDVTIDAKPLFSEDRSSVRLVYTVDEGIPYKVRNIAINGNNVIAGERLRQEKNLRSGAYFNSLPLSKDVNYMLDQYGERGHFFASVVPVPKFTEEPGIVDVIFEIDEDRPRYIRMVNAHLEGDHPHTMEVVPLNQSQLEPGDLANPKMIRRGESRIAGSGILDNVHVNVVPVDPGETTTMQVSKSRTLRGQNQIGYTGSWQQLFNDASVTGDPLVEFGHAFPASDLTSVGPETQPEPEAQQAPEPRKQSSVMFIGRPDLPRVVDYSCSRPDMVLNQPPPDVLVGSFPEEPRNDTVIRAQSPQPGPEQGDLVLQGSPYNNQFQALPPGWVDVNISAAEGRTGRLMFGAGINSDAGIVGSFVWDERNFNLFRPPQTFADIIEGRAWRGGGQRFRLEAAPGAQVSRYALSWTDPYFMYSDYSLGLSGFYFNRFYPDWDETRLGGRISVGKQWTPDWSGSIAMRLEDVEIENPRSTSASIAANAGNPAIPLTSVPELERVRGSNFLSSASFTVAHDTRDSSMLPTDGHYYTGTFEQAFGDFVYPRLEGDARHYFTMFQRADGSGRQVLTLAGNVGWSGNDTPAFEKYYAGGFQSFRGFAYRGVTPRGVDNISIGGNWQLLGTAEYRIPMTADDMINLVAFSDVGTVEQDVSVDNFRVTVGLGLRVVVPAMGPVPLAFDFGFPIKSAKFDDERIFSFYVGINR
ncbi:MAG: outer membrane protein assembly factor [Planctomycetaceae bacterium]